MRAKFLRQGADWDLQKMRVAYSADAARIVLEKVTGQTQAEWARVGAPLEAILADCHLELNERAAAGGTLKAVVTRFYLNPHLLQAQLEDKRLVNVRVKDPKKFKRGMEIPIVFDAAARVYELTRREPRFPGRW